MKKKLLILSDLWGFDQAAYLDLYLKQLKPHFEVQVYDSCVLADLPQDRVNQKERHQHFITAGIERAVAQLFDLESETMTALAFSVGGTIAWRAALAGLPIDLLFAISATRLRYEAHRPDCNIKLWYGAQDAFQPDEAWQDKMNLSAYQWPQLGHDIYKRPPIIKEICQELWIS